MFEIIGNPTTPAKRAIIRCTGLNEKGQRCKKRLLDYRLPARPVIVDAGVIEVMCTRCSTMNHVRVTGIVA